MNQSNFISLFESKNLSLLQLLQQIHAGQIQIPDLQRSFRWPNELVLDLIATISSGLPIGCILIHECGNSPWRFYPRPLEGVTLENPVEPELLILDGQQRMTALYSVLYSQNPTMFTSKTKRKVEYFWHYIDIIKALNSHFDKDEAVLSLPLSRKKRSSKDQKANLDCSTPEKEFQSLLFPCRAMFNFTQWRQNFCRHWNYAPAKIELIDQFELEIVKKFEHYQIPSVCLNAQLSKPGVCKAFIDINTKSLSLNFFDLTTALFDSRDFSLRSDWHNRQQKLGQYKVLSQLRETDFLSAIAFVTTHYRRHEALNASQTSTTLLPRVGGSRKEILELSVEEYQKYSSQVEQGFEEAARFLHAQKIFTPEDLPYQIQLVVLGAIFAVVEPLDYHCRCKLERWFWSGIFGELYSSWYEQRASKDMLEVPNWLLYGGDTPSNLKEAQLNRNRFQKITKRQGAFYKGISALLRQNGAIDFYTGELLSDANYFAEPIQAHHVFSKAWCRKMKVNSNRYNCLMNLTPLSEATNRLIGSRAPGDYLERMKQQGISRQRIDSILRSHLIYPTALWNNDFEDFFTRRERELNNLAASAMGCSNDVCVGSGAD